MRLIVKTANEAMEACSQWQRHTLIKLLVSETDGKKKRDLAAATHADVSHVDASL
jgi:hypothetical protein